MRVPHLLASQPRARDSWWLSELAIGQLGDSDPELRLELETELIIAATHDVRTRPLVGSWIPDSGAAPEPTSSGACMLLANMALEEVFTGGSREQAVAFADGALVGGRLKGTPVSPPSPQEAARPPDYSYETQKLDASPGGLRKVASDESMSGHNVAIIERSSGVVVTSDAARIYQTC